MCLTAETRRYTSIKKYEKENTRPGIMGTRFGAGWYPTLTLTSVTIQTRQSWNSVLEKKKIKKFVYEFHSNGMSLSGWSDRQHQMPKMCFQTLQMSVTMESILDGNPRGISPVTATRLRNSYRLGLVSLISAKIFGDKLCVGHNLCDSSLKQRHKRVSLHICLYIVVLFLLICCLSWSGQCSQSLSRL